MATTCKNCATTFDGNYCNNCGQSADTHAINWHYVWHDIQHGILHVDKGLFYTIKEMYTRPGATIREFIAGKRVKHFKPIAMVFLLATIYGLIYHYLGLNIIKFDNTPNAMNNFTDPDTVNEFMAKHYAALTLAYIPLYTLASYLAFRKSGYNFIEHGVLNCFIAGQKFLIQFLLLPVIYFYKYGAMLSLAIIMVTDVVLTIWVYTQFFNMFRLVNKWLRAIWSYILFIIIAIIILFIVGIIFLINTGIK